MLFLFILCSTLCIVDILGVVRYNVQAICNNKLYNRQQCELALGGMSNSFQAQLISRRKIFIFLQTYWAVIAIGLA